jgi:hypothetical protein
MEHTVARKLLALVNNKQNIERLSAYAESRIEFLRGQLETCTSEKDMRFYQGQIQEAKRLLTLREEVQQRAEEGDY